MKSLIFAVAVGLVPVCCSLAASPTPGGEAAPGNSVEASKPDSKKTRKPNLVAAFPQSVRTIGVVMPASILKKSSFDFIAAALRDAGYRLKIAPRLNFEKVASAEDRAKDFEEMWMDPEVDLVLCARGGTGADQILPFLDWDRLRTRKQKVLGFSNITRILNAMVKENAGEPFSGSTMSHFRYCDGATLAWLNKAIARAEMPEVKLNPLRAGECEGPACGGHITIFRDSVKAGQAPSAKGRIVFLECVRRQPEVLEHALGELVEMGYFDGAAGVVFGDLMSGLHGGEVKAKMDKVKKSFVGKVKCPVFDGYPYGHVPRSFAIDFNRRHRITTEGVLSSAKP